MREEKMESIRSFYPAWNRQDFGAALSDATPDFEIVPLPALLPFLSGQRPTRGEAEAKHFWGLFFEGFEEIRVEPKELIGSDDQVIAVLGWWARGRDGIEIERTMVDLWTFSGGLKASVQGFETKAEALEAAGLRD
jgi:ketosteroid isomerase-like protein